MRMTINQGHFAVVKYLGERQREEVKVTMKMGMRMKAYLFASRSVRSDGLTRDTLQ